MFENNIKLTRAPKITTNDIFEALGENGKYLTSFDISTLEACKKIVENFERYSDLLYCINSAMQKKEYTVKYKLQLPFTLTKNDVDVLSSILLKLNLLKEVFYSNTNNSYMLEINNTTDLYISKILTIGCAQKFTQVSSEILVSDKSFLLIRNGKIVRYHTEIAAGLEINVSSQPSQMKSLIKKINRKPNNISDVFIVSRFVKSNLYMFNNVISLSDFFKSCI